MPSLRNILFLALTAGIGIIAFFAVRSSPVKDAGTPDAGTRRTSFDVRTTAVRGESEPSREDELVDPDANRRSAGDNSPGATTVVDPLEVELTFAAPLATTSSGDEKAEPIRSGANARLEGSLRGSGGKPIRGTVTFLHGPNAGRVLQTDSAGRFGAGDLWQGLSVVRVEATSGLQVERQVQLGQLRTQPLHIGFANTSLLQGTVTDTRGKPIESAEVLVDGRLAMTDANGIFSFAGVPPGKLAATVRKEGYAITRREFGLGLQKTVAPEAFKIQLAEASTLEISIGARAGNSGPTTAVLMPAAGAGREIVQRGFPWYEINPIEIPARGSVTLQGLPAETVAIYAFHGGAQMKNPGETVRLFPGRTSTIELDLEVGPALRGVVTDGGKPVSGARVVFEAADQSVATARALGQKSPRSSQEMVMPRVPPARDETRTDAKGRFSFSRSASGVSTYYVTATSRDGTRGASQSVGPDVSKVALVLEPRIEDEGVLTVVLPGRFQGLPVEAQIDGVPIDPYVLGATEPLRFEGLALGSWVVSARWRGTDVVSRRVVIVDERGVEVEGELPRGAKDGQAPEVRGASE